MGCICSKPEDKEINNETTIKKTYSWDEKKKFVNPKNFIIENLDNQEEVKLPGSVNGEQFIIQNCKDSTIYVLDYINTISIDDCINCNIILGPVAGSLLLAITPRQKIGTFYLFGGHPSYVSFGVHPLKMLLAKYGVKHLKCPPTSAFIRNCKSCMCVIACGQFRMRDSTKINIFLFSATQPIIEASSGIYFGTYQIKYNNIQTHFQKANLNTKDKNWRVIYDFTPMECEENWNFLQNDRAEDYIADLKSESMKNELVKTGFSWTSNEISFSQN